MCHCGGETCYYCLFIFFPNCIPFLCLIAYLRFPGMILQLASTVWISILSWSAPATVLGVAVGARPVLEFSTGSPRRMPWSGSRSNMRVWSWTRPRILHLRSWTSKHQFMFPESLAFNGLSDHHLLLTQFQVLEVLFVFFGRPWYICYCFQF